MFDEYKGLPIQAKYLVYSMILPSLALGMFYTDISYFLTTVQGVSYALMGVVISVMGVSTFVASIPLGIAADRYGKRKLLIIGNVIASAIVAIFALTTNPAILLVAAIFEGVSEGAFAASSSALIAEKAGDERRTSVFSLFGFAQGIAFGIGSFIIPVVVVFQILGFSTRESHVVLYVILASLSLASTLIMLKITESNVKRETRAFNIIRTLANMKSKDVLIKFVVASAIIAFGAGIIVPLMTAWMKAQYGISDSLSGPILGVANIVIGVATLAAPALSRKLGLVKAIVVTQAISTGFMFATPLCPDYVSASIVYTSRAFLMNMSSPLQQSMIMGLVAEDERGVASGISAALWRLPNALSSFIGAWLIGAGLLAEPFFLAGLFYAVSIALFWIYFRETKMPEESSTETIKD
ncbi:MAG TPA: MFS transporter [Candidatus Acidoferrum sp.]|nr:MFS transporter [Candidatus Acidoferrum sp.]